jgi:hypothetical protein
VTFNYYYLIIFSVDLISPTFFLKRFVGLIGDLALPVSPKEINPQIPLNFDFFKDYNLNISIKDIIKTSKIKSMDDSKAYQKLHDIAKKIGNNFSIFLTFFKTSKLFLIGLFFLKKKADDFIGKNLYDAAVNGLAHFKEPMYRINSSDILCCMQINAKPNIFELVQNNIKNSQGQLLITVKLL